MAQNKGRGGGSPATLTPLCRSGRAVRQVRFQRRTPTYEATATPSTGHSQRPATARHRERAGRRRGGNAPLSRAHTPDHLRG